MERYKLTAAQAILLLALASPVTNAKPFHVAEHLASTGNFPSEEGRLLAR